MAKQEELTTKMHAEFIGDEIPALDLRVMSVYGAVVGRSVRLSDALKQDDLTEEQYRANLDWVLS